MGTLYSQVVKIYCFASHQVTSLVSSAPFRQDIPALLYMHLLHYSSLRADCVLSCGVETYLVLKVDLTSFPLILQQVGAVSEHNLLSKYNLRKGSQHLCRSPADRVTVCRAPELYPSSRILWIASSAYGDPDFSWCSGGDGRCGTARAQNINGGQSLFLYALINWAFFNGPCNGNRRI